MELIASDYTQSRNTDSFLENVEDLLLLKLLACNGYYYYVLFLFLACNDYYYYVCFVFF